MAIGELLAAVAAQRAEHVAGEALGVHAHQHVLLAGDVALDERHVMRAVDDRLVADRLELAGAVGMLTAVTRRTSFSVRRR